LGIRETKPGYFTAWLASHFPAGAGVTRDLGVKQQTQFASSSLTDGKAFFDQNIPVPTLGIVHRPLDDREALNNSSPPRRRGSDRRKCKASALI